MHTKFSIKFIFFSLLLVLLISCDDDSNEIGADIIGNDNFETGSPEFYDLNAITTNTGPVETLDLAVNALGIYKNPVFGTTKANIAIQLQLSTLNPTFDDALEPEIESVVLYVP